MQHYVVLKLAARRRQQRLPPPPSRHTAPQWRGAACGAAVGRTNYKREREESGSPDLEFAFTSASHGLELHCAAATALGAPLSRAGLYRKQREITPLPPSSRPYCPPLLPSANRGKNARPYSAEKKANLSEAGPIACCTYMGHAAICAYSASRCPVKYVPPVPLPLVLP